MCGALQGKRGLQQQSVSPLRQGTPLRIRLLAFRSPHERNLFLAQSNAERESSESLLHPARDCPHVAVHLAGRAACKWVWAGGSRCRETVSGKRVRVRGGRTAVKRHRRSGVMNRSQSQMHSCPGSHGATITYEAEVSQMKCAAYRHEQSRRDIRMCAPRKQTYRE